MSSKNTIEVPVELIEAGDIDAIRKLVPVSGLFGRWATHPQYARVLIADNRPDRDGKVLVVWASRSGVGGASGVKVHLDSLTLDPVELVTEQDFRDAPEGTIVTHRSYLPREKDLDVWDAFGGRPYSHEVMAKYGPWQVVRWSEEEQA